MPDIFRDAPLGQIIRKITFNNLFQYVEEKDDFEIPEAYRTRTVEKPRYATASAQTEIAEQSSDEDSKEDFFAEDDVIPEEDGFPLSYINIKAGPHGEHIPGLTRVQSAHSAHGASRRPGPRLRSPSLSHFNRHSWILQSNRNSWAAHSNRNSKLSDRNSWASHSNRNSRADLEQAYLESTLPKQPDAPVEPEHLDDGTILVDWYSTTDPENPQNWSFGKKSLVAMQINLYTMAVYMGSSIITASYPGLMEEYDIDLQIVSLSLSMYVFAYGIGPMLFAPLSELPSVGRNPPYLFTFALFTLLTIPAALISNYPGLVVLRFLLGFFGSPCLAAGGASLQDMFSLIKLPYILSLWSLATTLGPALGPTISGFSVAAMGWRWSMWEMLWLSAPIWLLMFICLPETSSSTILLRRAQRLRKRTGNMHLKSQSEIDEANTSFSALAMEALYRPLQLMVLDPSIGFTAFYTALIYAIYYSYFEAFPLVYQGLYGFNLGETGLTFLAITVGILIGIVIYWSYQYFIVEPRIRTSGMSAPEASLKPAVLASFLLPAGLFLFAWTAREDVHWIVTTVGIVLSTIAIFFIMNCIFLYLPMSYPQYAASLFAGNDFARSTLAAGAIHFAQPLFHDLGVDKGVSLLGGLTCGCIGGMLVLFFFGAKLRARSRFAAK